MTGNSSIRRPETLVLRAAVPAALGKSRAGWDSTLSGAPMRPEGAGPSEILLVRHLRLVTGPRMTDAERARLRSDLSALRARAARPGGGPTLETADAVRFRDLAELIAWLALTGHDGTGRRAWWRRAGLRYAGLRDARPDGGGLLGQAPGAFLPAIHGDLDRWAGGEAVVLALGAAEAVRLLRRLARAFAFDLPPLPYQPAGDAARPAGGKSARPAASALLSSLCRRLHRRPSEATSSAFRQWLRAQVRAVFADLPAGPAQPHRQETTAHPPVPTLRPDHPLLPDPPPVRRRSRTEGLRHDNGTAADRSPATSSERVARTKVRREVRIAPTDPVPAEPNVSGPLQAPRSGWRSGTLSASGERDRGRPGGPPPSGRARRPLVAPPEDIPSAPPPVSTVPQADAPLWQGAAAATGLGGVFYLWRFLEHAGMTARAAEWGLGGWALLEAAARAILPELAADPRPEDPLWLFLADLDGRDPGKTAGPEVLAGPNAAAVQPGEDPLWQPSPGLQQWTTRGGPELASAFAGMLALDRAEAGARLVRPATVHAGPTHVDVIFPLDAADPAIRRAGLDIDPGWVPLLGRVLLFHYD